MSEPAAYIPLWTRDGIVGNYAMVDEADFERLNERRWTLLPGGYAKTGEGIYMAREVAGLMPGDPRCVHHINEVKLDNRRANLKICADRSEASRQEHRKFGRSHASARLRLYTFTELRQMAQPRRKAAV